MTISRLGWRWYTDPDEVARRAGGRRRHNARRQLQAEIRRILVLRLLKMLGYRRGVQAEIARLLGVSEATISRDVASFCAPPVSRHDPLAILDAEVQQAAAKRASTPAEHQREVAAIYARLDRWAEEAEQRRRRRWAHPDQAIDKTLGGVLEEILAGQRS